MFGEVVDDEMILNDLGKVAEECWQNIPQHYPQVRLDGFVIMPNHMHGIIVIDNDAHQENDSVGAKYFSPNVVSRSRANDDSPLPKRPRGTSQTIGAIVRGFKIGVTKWARENTNTYAVWQRNYHEKIIRDQNEYNTYTEYIKYNPQKWNDDEFFVT